MILGGVVYFNPVIEFEFEFEYEKEEEEGSGSVDAMCELWSL